MRGSLLSSRFLCSAIDCFQRVNQRPLLLCLQVIETIMSAISQADYETYIAICVAQSAMSGHRLKVDSKPETVIGTGSYGKVFPAGYGGHPLSQLALKVTVAEDRDYSEFQRQRLAHHCIQVHGNSRINIPQVYEHFSCSIDGGIQGLILDFVAAKKTGLYSSMPAPSLKQILEGPTHNQHVLHLRKLVFSSPQIRYTLVHDILVAVQEFEDLPFVNSDIGPGNILIQESESDDHLVATFIDWGKGHRKALQSDLNKMSDRDFSRFETLEANTYTRLFSGLQSIMSVNLYPGRQLTAR